MKKLLRSLLPFFLAVAMCISPVSAAAQGAAPDAIQPEHILTAPGVLYQVSNAHQVYVYRREVPDGYYEAVLNTFGGRELLVANEISLLPDWILVENKSGKFGVYDYTMKEVLPCQYESLWMIDADTCIVYTKIYYTNRFGGVHGDSLRCNLRTGEITDVGITDSGAWWQTDSGEEVAAKRMDRVTPLSFQEAPAATGYIVQGTDAGGAYSAAYNGSQQLILKSYQETLTFEAGDLMLLSWPFDFDPEKSNQRVYSGRGRWLTYLPEIGYYT